MTTPSLSEITQALEAGERFYRAFKGAGDIAQALGNAQQVELETRARAAGMADEAAAAQADRDKAASEAEATRASMAEAVEQAKVKADALVQEARIEAKDVREKANAKAKDAEARAERAMGDVVALEAQAKALRDELTKLAPAVEKARAVAAAMAGA